MKIKSSLLSQGNIQTLDQLGLYQSTNENFMSNLTTTLAGYGRKHRPTYVRYDYVPVFGGRQQMENNYIINAVVEEFIKARAANTSLAKYESPDIAKWLIASDGINTLVAEIKRYFKANFMGDNARRNQLAAGQVSCVSKCTGGTINGNTNIANLIARYNSICSRLNGIKVPKGVPMIDYHYNLSSKVYNEDETLKSPHYYFRAVSVPFWDVNGIYGEVGAIRWLNLSTSSNVDADNSIQTMLDILEKMADVYTTDTVVNNMFAEFAKANMTEVYNITPYAENDTKSIQFETNISQLMAVKNSRISPMGRLAIEASSTNTGLYIQQTTNVNGAVALKYKTVIGSNTYDNKIESEIVNLNTTGGLPKFHPALDYGTSTMGDFKCLVNFHKDENSAQEVFDMLQFRHTVKGENNATSFEVYSAGLVLLVGIQLLTPEINNSMKTCGLVQCNIVTTEESRSSEEYLNRLNVGFNYTKNYAMYQCIPNFLIGKEGATSMPVEIYVWDADNLITINVSTVEKLLNVIVQSGITYSD